MPGLAWSSARQNDDDSHTYPRLAAAQVQQVDQLLYPAQDDVVCMVTINSEADQQVKPVCSAPTIAQHTSAPVLPQLPAAALAAVAEHLTTAEKLQLGRLVFGQAHPHAAAAVLGTVRSCTVKNPQSTSERACCARSAAHCLAGFCPASSISSPCCCLGAVGSMLLLQQLSLQLHLQEQAYCWSAAISSLSRLNHLALLEVKLTGAAWHAQKLQEQQQSQQLGHGVAHQVSTLLQAIGQLQKCTHLTLQLDDCQTAAGGGASILRPDSLQPLLRLTQLQSLSLSTSGRLPMAALQQLGRLSRLTSLHLKTTATAQERVENRWGVVGCSYESAIADSLLPLCPQLKQLSLVSYFHHQQQSVGNSNGTCLLRLLQGLNPKGLLQLDLSQNSSSLFTETTAAVAALTRLQSLHIAGTWVAAEPMSVVGQALRQLTLLDVSHTSAASAHLHDQYGEAVLPLHRWLPYCTALKELRLQARPLTSQDMCCIFSMPQLQHLDMAAAHIDPTALATAILSSSRQIVNSNVAKLVSLSLRGIRIGPDRFASVRLDRLTALQTLDLRGCRPGATAAAALRRAVPGLQVVQMEDLDWADEGLEWLIGDYF